MSNQPTNLSTNKQEQISGLKEERKKLRQKLADIEADYRKGLTSDSDDQAVELENADVLAGIAKAVSEELARVEERLAELE